jgi:hypothetical protein
MTGTTLFYGTADAVWPGPSQILLSPSANQIKEMFSGTDALRALPVRSCCNAQLRHDRIRTKSGSVARYVTVNYLLGTKSEPPSAPSLGHLRYRNQKEQRMTKFRLLPLRQCFLCWRDPRWPSTR